jgi:hypothetical protein
MNWRVILSWVILGTAANVLAPSPAEAVPAFARQTDQPCAACHVGSFGPQLTAYGRNFKLNGYTWGNNVSALNAISGMAFGGLEHTDGDLRKGNELPSSGSLSHFAGNDNWTVDQASLFYGGRILENLGMLAQATYKNPNASFTWDNTDIRYADTTEVFGSDLLYGVTLNNNPSVQDVWQTTPGWWFPYLGSDLAPAPGFAPQLFGAQAQKVGGLGAYGLWNDLVYAELTAYHSLSPVAQRTLGITGSQDADYLKGLNPYWRIALQHDYGTQYVAIGSYGMIFNRYPGNDRTQGADRLTDYALDATYQATLAGGDHIVSLYATALREALDLKATFNNPNLGGSDNPRDHMSSFRANASYSYHNRYGVTLSRFAIFGNTDATYYGTESGKPNSSGWTTQFDVTPFGTDDSPGFPYFNARFFVQYTVYDRFDGAKSNYDGTGRNASDNNTIFTGVWMAF